MDRKIIIAGFGGQGVLFTGKVVAYCGMIDGLQLSWLPSYGPEMRGGTANCSVCLSDRAIGSPLVTAPDLLIAMNAPSYDKFIGDVVPGGTVVYDESMITPSVLRDGVNTFGVPAAALSNSQGLQGIANMILLGKALRETGIASAETLEKAIAKCVPAKKAHLLEHNIRAVKLGMTL